MRADLTSSGFNNSNVSEDRSVVQIKCIYSKCKNKPKDTNEWTVKKGHRQSVPYTVYRNTDSRHIISGRRVSLTHTVLSSSARAFPCFCYRGNTDAHSLHCCKALWSHFTSAGMWVRSCTHSLIHYKVRCMISPCKRMQC